MVHFSSLTKRIEKKCRGETFFEELCFRFIDSVRVSLNDMHYYNSLTCSNYNINSKLWGNCKVCKNVNSIRIFAMNGMEYAKLIKDFQIKECYKRYENWKCCLKYVEVREEKFIFECEKCEKRLQHRQNTRNQNFWIYLKFAWIIYENVSYC